jgi:hypothetical protein
MGVSQCCWFELGTKRKHQRQKVNAGFNVGIPFAELSFDLIAML